MTGIPSGILPRATTDKAFINLPVTSLGFKNLDYDAISIALGRSIEQLGLPNWI